MSILQALLVGIFSGLSSSLLFFILLRRLRPKIEISPFIANNKQGEHHYFDFKIINKAKRPAINIQLNVVLAAPTNTEGGPIYQTVAIELIKDNFFELGKYDKKDKGAYYAQRFCTKMDIEKLWKNDNSHIRLRVMATDSESGFSRAFLKEFHTKRNSIKNGVHKFGTSLGVS